MTTTRSYDDVTWVALRSYQPDSASYTGQTRLAMRVCASGQLSATLDRVSATAAQKVPTWNGTTWSAGQRIRLAGVTSRRQAAMEASLAAAAQTYHRRRLRWTMGPAAVTTLHRGDVVWITHSLIDGGASGRLKSLDATRTRLDLGRDVTLTSGTDHLLLQSPDGTLSTHTATGTAVATGETNLITIAPAMASPGAGVTLIPEDVVWRFYSGSSAPVKARLVSVAPRSDGTMACEAIDESPEY